MSYLFNASYFLTSIMLFAQTVIILNLARESFLVFWDEHVCQGVSKTHEKRRMGFNSKAVAQKRDNGGSDSHEQIESGNGPSQDNSELGIHNGRDSKVVNEDGEEKKEESMNRTTEPKMGGGDG